MCTYVFVFLDGFPVIFSRLANAESRSLLSSSSCLMAWSRSSTALAFSLSMRSRSLSANSRLSCNAWVGFFSSPLGDRFPIKDNTCNCYIRKCNINIFIMVNAKFIEYFMQWQTYLGQNFEIKEAVVKKKKVINDLSSIRIMMSIGIQSKYLPQRTNTNLHFLPG